MISLHVVTARCSVRTAARSLVRQNKLHAIQRWLLLIISSQCNYKLIHGEKQGKGVILTLINSKSERYTFGPIIYCKVWVSDLSGRGEHFPVSVSFHPGGEAAGNTTPMALR